MKILGLLRHAKSDWDDASQRDFDRGLNARGRQGAQVIGAHIRDHGVKWDRLIASPAVRVKQTLHAALPAVTPVFDQRLYLASFDTIAETIEAHAGSGVDEAQALLLELVAPGKENDLFREAVVKFPTATYAVLECDIDHWADLKRYCAKLVHFARPRDLDPALGPESY
ncbi:MAG: histidine phosphatase family protein [Alphaproteobacteria bacterium HGW-Alphaproteobacteria-14]|nr:MAG: histidine phosphatase family protein [Alphaproteobacteria bacterium HGW-Alphaproteobacteria-14]